MVSTIRFLPIIRPGCVLINKLYVSPISYKKIQLHKNKVPAANNWSAEGPFISRPTIPNGLPALLAGNQFCDL
jgi:hypothetical protein